MPDPTDIAGLTAWYKADAGTSSVVDNTAISQWDDQSGNADHATQATGAAQPTYQTNELNGEPIVRFDGTDDFMDASGVSESQPNTIFLVAKSATGSSSRTALDGISSRQAIYQAGDTITVYAGTAESSMGTSWGTTNFHVVTLVFNGASSSGRVDGAAVTLSPANPGANALTGLRIGAFTADAARWSGDIAEIIVYSGALSTDDQEWVEQYIFDKYGVGIDHGLPEAAEFERSAAVSATASISVSGGVPSATPPAVKVGPQRLHGPLTILITHQDGYVTRLGADEPDAAWVPFGITWTSALPGGWRDASWNLRRRIDQDVPLRLLDEVVILDDHGQTMYEGRIHKLPRQHGDDYLLGVECMGWASHLLDDPSVPYFFVDRNMGSWQSPGLNRRVTSGSSAPWETDYRASVDGRFLQFEGPGDAAGGRAILINSRAEVVYRCPPATTAAKVMYRGTEANTTSVEAAAIYTDDNDAMSSATSNALTLDDTLNTVTLSAAERYLMLRANASAQHTPTSPFSRRFSKLGVYSNNVLTSAEISGEPDGYYIDDMLAWALSRGAPKLNYSTGADGSIQRPNVIVPHACDNALGTTERIVLDLNKYVIWDWLVYDNRTFHYRPTDPGRLTWDARLDQGVHLTLEGDDVERAINGVLVTYTTFDGTQKVAGPVGSGVDYESELLGDTDPEGTVNAHGYTRRWVDYPVNFSLADDSYAALIGAAYLAQTQLPSRSGDMTLGHTVGHPSKGDRPSREVRAGDWIRLSDHPADVARRVIQVTHNDDSKQTTVSVGNDLNKVDAMLEQAAVASQVALGG
jgi:hypothetical protein